MAFDPLSIGLSLAGGLLGASGNDTSSEAVKKMDPRMDSYIYGPDGQSGLMATIFGLLQEQSKNGGLNDLQRQGMEMQRQYLMSPQYTQGYNQMANLGMSLMGGGVAANPFTQGAGVGSQQAQSNPFSYTGSMDAQLPTYNVQAPQLTQPKPVTPAPVVQAGSSSSAYAPVAGTTSGDINAWNRGNTMSPAAVLASMSPSFNTALLTNPYISGSSYTPGYSYSGFTTSGDGNSDY